MSHRLIILRHAKAKREPADNDAARPLRGRGKRDAERVGRLFSDQRLKIDHTVTSPSERTLQTARRVLKSAGHDPRSITLDERVYLAGLEALLDVIRGLPEKAKTVLLVGHNPGMEMLTAYLTGAPTVMITGAFADVAIDGPWSDVDARAGTLTAFNDRNTDTVGYEGDGMGGSGE